MQVIRKRFVFALLVLLSLVGCDAPITVRPLPAPSPETPVVNVPGPLRQSNWVASNGEGSCVHASLTSHLRWQNQLQLADAWRQSHSGGEYASRLRQRLDAAGVPYTYTEAANPAFLDWCHNTRRGAILWWKPSHCCTFLGWVEKGKQQYAAILDNNHVERIELTPRDQFLRLWAGYGGFALAVTGEPATHIPWRSYEIVE